MFNGGTPPDAIVSIPTCTVSSDGPVLSSIGPGSCRRAIDLTAAMRGRRLSWRQKNQYSGSFHEILLPAHGLGSLVRARNLLVGLLTAKPQRFTATATKVGAEITVPDATGTMPFTSYIGPRVTGLVDGGAVVVWTGNEDDAADPESTSGSRPRSSTATASTSDRSSTSIRRPPDAKRSVA
jgi:hypothetical protein